MLKTKSNTDVLHNNPDISKDKTDNFNSKNVDECYYNRLEMF